MSRVPCKVPKDEADEKGYWLVPFPVADGNVERSGDHARRLRFKLMA